MTNLSKSLMLFLAIFLCYALGIVTGLWLQVENTPLTEKMSIALYLLFFVYLCLSIIKLAKCPHCNPNKEV